MEKNLIVNEIHLPKGDREALEEEFALGQLSNLNFDSAKKLKINQEQVDCLDSYRDVFTRYFYRIIEIAVDNNCDWVEFREDVDLYLELKAFYS